MANEKHTTTASSDTGPIFRLIRRVRQLLRGSWVATGLALSIAIYLGTLLTLALFDLLVPFWPAMRLIALVLVVVPSVWVFVTGVLRPLFRRLGNTQVARKIETHLPGIHNRLVSCVDLSDDTRRNGHSPEFYRRLVSEALERIRGFRAQAVLDRRHLRRAAAALGFTLAIFVICCFLLSDRLPTAMARIFRPWADIPPATGVEYTVTPGDAKVPRGDEIEFAARVTKGEPRDLRVEIVPDDGGETIWHDFVARKSGEWSRTLAGLETSFHYRVHGGGTWSKQYHITMVDRPRIEDLQVVLHYPEYFELGDEGVIPQPTPDVTGPETSGVEVRVRSEGDVADGEIQLLDVAWDKVPVAEREERIWFDGALPKGAVGEGNWQWNDDKLLVVAMTQANGAQPDAATPSVANQQPLPQVANANQPADAQAGNPANIKKAHTEPPAAGVHGHRFHTAPIGFLVEPAEYLFAWVYIVPDQRPESIMLEWHDGQNWEHRAFWGDDKIGVGQPNTTSHHALGALPKAGEWTRLEVPAKDVGLTNKSIKGMGFTLHGGQCLWGPAGAVPSPTRDERRLVVKKTFPLASATAGQWSGTFPLVGAGLYRVELRNELKYANQAMKEAKFTAIVDNPPQVTIERPGTDLVLSQPKKVPLTIAAYDDFALKHLRVLLQRGDSEGFREVVHKKYRKQKRGDTALVALDLVPLDLKPNEQVRYRAQVEDRKGQVAETRDFIIRIAADGNAADQQLARFEQTQDAFQQKLAQLIAEQAKVKENVEKLAQDYAPLEKKIEDAEAEAKAKQDAAADPAAQANKPPVALDPETQKKLDELRQKLAEAAGKEEQNANVGKQLVNELAEAVKQADQLRMLPPELVSEMNAAQQAFDQLAARPMEDLAKDLRQASTPNQTDPNLAEMADASQHVQAELEAIAARLKALENARKNLDGGLDEALAKLRDELTRQEAAGAERGLDELRDMLAALREQLQNFEGQQSELLDATNVTPDMLMAELEKRQKQLERASDPPLEEARELVGRRPHFPDAPAMGEEDEMTMPPEEADTPEDDESVNEGEPGEHDPESGEEMEEDEPLYEPALGGPRPKLDPRFADKRPRPMPEGKADPLRQAREQLADRQFDRLEELNLSQQSLAADERALEALMEELRQAMGEPPPGMEPGEMANSGDPHPPGEPHAGEPAAGQEPGETSAEDAAAQQLSQLLQSSAMQQAMELAQRIRQMRTDLAARQAGQPQKGPARTSRGMSLGNLAPTTTSGTIVEVELSKLDPNTRAIVLKMKPRMREELLQGMREQGPEGYRKFIQDYFKRLTEVKQP